MAGSAFDRIADRVARFKRTSDHSGVGSCPTGAHPNGDRSRGLSVRAVDDRVLIYCHAGCGASDIVDALGLTLSDLYDGPQVTSPRTRSRIAPGDLLTILDEEVLTVGLIALDLAEHGEITAEQRSRLITAAHRIGRAREHGRE